MGDEKEQALTVQDEMVVSMAYTLKVDGEIVEETDAGETVQFIHGIGQLLPGLEREIYGMKIGEVKRILVSPEEGYGNYEEEEEAFAEIPVNEFPDEVPLEPGVEVMLQDDEGDEVEAYITEIVDDVVYLSLNHPLAGKELDFEVKIVELRGATPEELEHEHVHED